MNEKKRLADPKRIWFTVWKVWRGPLWSAAAHDEASREGGPLCSDNSEQRSLQTYFNLSLKLNLCQRDKKWYLQKKYNKWKAYSSQVQGNSGCWEEENPSCDVSCHLGVGHAHMGTMRRRKQHTSETLAEREQTHHAAEYLSLIHSIGPFPTWAQRTQ